MRSTFQCEYVRCGKKNCKTCPHGPYWYEYWHRNGRMGKRYHGKHKPAEMAHPDVSRKIARWDDIFNKRTATSALAYEILGLDPKRSHNVSDIQAAYRKRAFAVHPDRGGDTRECSQVNAAYSYLKSLY